MSEIMWVQRKVIFDNNNSPNSQSAPPKAPLYLWRLDLYDRFSCVTKPLLTGQ